MDASAAASTVATLAAALIGGALSLAGSMIVIRRTLKAQEDAQKRELRGLCRAIYVEINTLWVSYSESTKGNIEALKDGEVFTYEFPGIDRSRCAVYEGNADKIGSLHDESLIRAIVTYYTSLESLRMLLAANAGYLRTVLDEMTRTGDRSLKTALQGMPVLHQVLITHAQVMKKCAKELSVTYAEVESRMANSLGQAAAP